MESNVPPVWMGALLERACPWHLEDEVVGDFYETYDYNSRRRGRRYALWKATLYLLISLPRLLITQLTTTYNHLDMLKNYILIAFRNIRKQFAYSFINIGGLAIGLACCLMIALYVSHELSYDNFHNDKDQVYRVNMTFHTPQGDWNGFMTPTALLPTMKSKVKEVISGTRLYYIGGFNASTVQRGNEISQVKEFFYADSTFFDVFSFPMIAGNPENALTEPASIIMTERMALKFFNKTDVLNESVKVNGRDYVITAVMGDVPDNSHFTFDFIASFSTLEASKNEIWGSANYATYIKLMPHTNAQEIASAFTSQINEEMKGQFGPVTLDFDFIALEDIHLRSTIPDEMQPQNSIDYIYIISFVGLLILVIACINYMNLATARSLDRAREVGMRKVLGAYRKQVFAQFIGESFVIVSLSIIAAVGIVLVSLPAFNELAGKDFTVMSIFTDEIIVGLVATLLVVTLLAGAYPAVALSAFNPNTVLKGSFKRSKNGHVIRQLLVVVQFAISITLVVSTFIVGSQLDYMRNKRLGYNKDNVLVMPSGRHSEERFNTLQTTLENLANVEAVSIATESPVNIGGGYSITAPEVTDQSISVNAVGTSFNFIEAMQMNVIAGRSFVQADMDKATSENYEERRYSFVINQALLDHLMIDEERVIGLKVDLNGRKGEVVGVIENFHSTSLHSAITPMVLFADNQYLNALFIRLKPGDTQKTLMEVEEKWKTIVPEEPFVFEFMDEQYDAMYNAEIRLGNVFKVFAVLAIIIACLGLFGLVSFAVEQRSKEIGVRKVLGASVASIVTLLSKDFARLVIVAFLLSVPMAWYMMSNWLADFAYKIDMPLLAFAVAGVSLLVIAMLTVSFQSVKAATSNPVSTLRND